MPQPRPGKRAFGNTMPCVCLAVIPRPGLGAADEVSRAHPIFDFAAVVLENPKFDPHDLLWNWTRRDGDRRESGRLERRKTFCERRLTFALHTQRLRPAEADMRRRWGGVLVGSQILH
jgi:hypothetical protein